MKQYKVPRFYFLITRTETWKLLREVAIKIAASRFVDDQTSPQSVLQVRDFLNAFVFLRKQSDVTAAIGQELRRIETTIREKMQSHALDINKLIKSAREAGDESDAQKLERDLAKYVVPEEDDGQT